MVKVNMYHNNEKETKILVSIFSSDNFSTEEKDLINNLRKVTQYYRKHRRHQYHLISRIVNARMKEGEDTINYILNNIDNMLTFLEHKREKCNKIIKSESSNKLSIDEILLDLEKLFDHIALEEERIKTNGIIIRNSNQEIASNVIDTFNSVIENFQSKVDEISNSLNANIITVVGLFSAIIFVFFGGITSISDLINGVWKIQSKKELVIPLIVLLVAGFIIFNIVFLLLYSIAKIVDKNIGSSVSGSSARWYWADAINDECYGVFYDGKPNGKCYRSLEKAEKVAKRKRRISSIKASIQMLGKKIFLRFPYVTIINFLFIISIVYLYVHL